MSKSSSPTVNRRAVFAAAGAAGALGALAVASVRTAPAPAQQAAQAPEPDTASGYRLTEHVKRYYATARV